MPINDRKHQLNVFGYIGDHKAKGAWVWTFREGIYWREESDGAGQIVTPDSPVAGPPRPQSRGVPYVLI